MTNDEIVDLWRDKVVKVGNELDADADKEGHDWHSLWAGFVIGLGRMDLAGWLAYMELGFPVEMEGVPTQWSAGDLARIQRRLRSLSKQSGQTLGDC